MQAVCTRNHPLSPLPPLTPPLPVQKTRKVGKRKMATGDCIGSRSKHVDIKYCNVTEAVKEKLIQLQHCPTVRNIANILTKPVAVDKHQENVKAFGLSAVQI
uniref:Uncharacterized protein n=1 Tax=Micrurus spixii TaxID=129469 RepID=A0A2D4M5M9_9SAUR